MRTHISPRLDTWIIALYTSPDDLIKQAQLKASPSSSGTKRRQKTLVNRQVGGQPTLTLSGKNNQQVTILMDTGSSLSVNDSLNIHSPLKHLILIDLTSSAASFATSTLNSLFCTSKIASDVASTVDGVISFVATWAFESSNIRRLMT